MEGHITPEYAELIGIIIGDGSISYYQNYHQFRLTISLNSKTDIVYAKERVIPLISKIWKITPRIYFQPNENNIKIRFYSKEIVEELLEIGLPKNKKYRHLRIPKIISNDIELLKNCIRGIFDTDGSIFKKYGKYAQIGIKTSSERLRNEIVNLLKYLGLMPSIDKKFNYIFIHRQKEIELFFKIIGSSNPKHILRFIKWKETNSVPKMEEIVDMLGKWKRYCKTLPFKL